MARTPVTARRMWRRLETVHAVTYFSPEPIGALSDAGYRGFWMGYFAGRAAPLGPVGPRAVESAFYNFSRERVMRSIPDAWSFAPPAAALAARANGSVGALARMLSAAGVGGDALETASVLARRAAESAAVEGRPLFAANADLPWPSGNPLQVLWHASTLLREHRGDGHIAALVAADINGRQSNVLHAASGAVPRQVLVTARHYADAEWSQLSAELSRRGLLDDEGRLTDDGSLLKEEIEKSTDAVALQPYTVLTDAELDALDGALEPIARAVVDAGEIPTSTPMGLDLGSDD